MNKSFYLHISLYLKLIKLRTVSSDLLLWTPTFTGSRCTPSPTGRFPSTPSRWTPKSGSSTTSGSFTTWRWERAAWVGGGLLLGPAFKGWQGRHVRSTLNVWLKVAFQLPQRPRRFKAAISSFRGGADEGATVGAAAWLSLVLSPFTTTWCFCFLCFTSCHASDQMLQIANYHVGW